MMTCVSIPDPNKNRDSPTTREREWECARIATHDWKAGRLLQFGILVCVACGASMAPVVLTWCWGSERNLSQLDLSMCIHGWGLCRMMNDVFAELFGLHCQPASQSAVTVMSIERQWSSTWFVFGPDFVAHFFPDFCQKLELMWKQGCACDKSCLMIATVKWTKNVLIHWLSQWWVTLWVQLSNTVILSRQTQWIEHCTSNFHLETHCDHKSSKNCIRMSCDKGKAHLSRWKKIRCFRNKVIVWSWNCRIVDVLCKWKWSAQDHNIHVVVHNITEQCGGIQLCNWQMELNNSMGSWKIRMQQWCRVVSFFCLSQLKSLMGLPDRSHNNLSKQSMCFWRQTKMTNERRMFACQCECGAPSPFQHLQWNVVASVVARNLPVSFLFCAFCYSQSSKKAGWFNTVALLLWHSCGYQKEGTVNQSIVVPYLRLTYLSVKTLNVILQSRHWRMLKDIREAWGHSMKLPNTVKGNKLLEEEASRLTTPEWPLITDWRTNRPRPHCLS